MYAHIVNHDQLFAEKSKLAYNCYRYMLTLFILLAVDLNSSESIFDQWLNQIAFLLEMLLNIQTNLSDSVIIDCINKMRRKELNSSSLSI